VKKYLGFHHIKFHPDRIPAITAAVKEMSAQKNRRLILEEVKKIAGSSD
jgi:2-isopropylmalate synthase